jgi:hypothetical protein
MDNMGEKETASALSQGLSPFELKTSISNAAEGNWSPSRKRQM